MALLYHPPTSPIVLVSTCATRSSIAQTVRIERLPTSLGVDPTCGPAICSVVQRDWVISMLHTNIHFFFWNTLARAVWTVAP